MLQIQNLILDAQPCCFHDSTSDALSDSFTTLTIRDSRAVSPARILDNSVLLH